MEPTSDPQYQKLLREYEQSLRQYKIAAEKRKRFRDTLTVRRSPVMRALAQSQRRPVGSPADFRIPHGPTPPVKVARPPRARRIYLGEILGFAKIIYTDPVMPAGDVDPTQEVDRLYGEISRQLYWNAKAHYEKCKNALLDYSYRDRARGELGHAADLQLLGVDDEGEAMADVRREVEAGCKQIWSVYQASGTPKSEAALGLLVEGLADAQFVGLDTPTATAMQDEVSRLLNSGKVGRGP